MIRSGSGSVRSSPKAAARPPAVVPQMTLLLLTFAAVLLGALAFFVWTSYQDFRTVRVKQSRLEETVKQIGQLDQFMTAFARLGAAYADLRKEENYLETATKRERLMRTLKSISPKVFANTEALDMNAVKLKVSEHESKVFDYVRQGKRDLAEAMVFEEGYQKQKDIYELNFNAVSDLLRRNLADSFAAQKDRTTHAALIGAVILPVMFLLHIVAMGRLKHYYALSRPPA
jgi:hypothetical protein